METESRKTTSSIAREYIDGRRGEHGPLPDARELMAMVRESQRMAAETVRARAISFLEYCLMSPQDVAMQMIADVVEGKRKEF